MLRPFVRDFRLLASLGCQDGVGIGRPGCVQLGLDVADMAEHFPLVLSLLRHWSS
jgi:hypothetical protein